MLYMAPYSIDGIGLIVVSSCEIDRERSTDDKFYWNAKGHFYGEDEYGHTDGVYDFDAVVYSDGEPSSSYSFNVYTPDLTVKKSN